MSREERTSSLVRPKFVTSWVSVNPPATLVEVLEVVTAPAATAVSPFAFTAVRLPVSCGKYADRVCCTRLPIAWARNVSAARRGWLWSACASASPRYGRRRLPAMRPRKLQRLR